MCLYCSSMSMFVWLLLFRTYASLSAHMMTNVVVFNVACFFLVRSSHSRQSNLCFFVSLLMWKWTESRRDMSV